MRPDQRSITMDGAKKTLLASAFTILLGGSAAAYAGVISVPGFNLEIPTPTPSAPPAPGQNMAVPSIPSGAQLPPTTQPPTGVTTLPSIATSGQSSTPIYGNPVPSTDSTGAAGAAQNLASSCYASGGTWNQGTSTCSINSANSISSQCVQMGGQYDWAKNQCQMASLPGSGAGGGWTIGAWLNAPGYIGSPSNGGFMRVISSGGQVIVQAGQPIVRSGGTCQLTHQVPVDRNAYNYNASSYWYCPYGGQPKYTYSGYNYDYITVSCPDVYKWSNSNDSCSSTQAGQTRPGVNYLQVNYQWNVTNTTSFNFGAGNVTPVGWLGTSSHTAYNVPWNLSGNPYPN